MQHLAALQEKLYAQDRWAMLCVFQAMDAAGKDGTIKHVMSGVNPQGVQVTSFKAPGPEALAHDFLQRCVLALPERGRIGIFNRSHYEEVLVVRVHPEILEREHLPRELLGKKLWEHRMDAIAAFERHLSRQGTVVLKFFLHVSKAEQKRRFLERLEETDKHWKFSASDLTERDFWDDYQYAYQEAIAATATPEAPWFIVPGRQQVVHPDYCRGGDDRGAGGAGPAHPGPDRSRRSCAGGGTTKAGERTIAPGRYRVPLGRDLRRGAPIRHVTWCHGSKRTACAAAFPKPMRSPVSRIACNPQAMTREASSYPRLRLRCKIIGPVDLAQ